MDLQNRRITRSSTGNNENDIVAARKAVVKPNEVTAMPRRAFADSRNTREVKPDIVKKEAVKDIATRQRKIVASPIKHPELVGIDREFQAADYIDDVYNYLLAREKECVIPETVINKTTVTPKMRSILVDWLIQVHGRFHLIAETLHLTVYLVDCCLAKMRCEKSDLQLVGMACMLVACKFEEMYVPDIKDFEYIADNAFSKRQILKTEAKVLTAANFSLSPPHTITFLRWMTKEVSSTARQHNMAKFFVEMSLVDQVLGRFLPSQIALMSLFVAHALTNKELPVGRLLEMIGWSEEALTESITVFAKAVLRNYGNEKLNAVRSKFTGTKFGGVANISEDDLEILKRL